MEATAKLCSLNLHNTRTYLFALFFVAGNIIVPQLCHLIPNGGLMFLPIYFFTLVGAYKYGLSVGMITAVFSPLLNHVLFGMPAAAMLPAIMAKSVILAISASIVAKRFKKVSIVCMAVVVLSYQLLGTMIEWAMVSDFNAAIQDFRIGIPGMLLQVFGGYAVIRYILTK